MIWVSKVHQRAKGRAELETKDTRGLELRKYYWLVDKETNTKRKIVILDFFKNKWIHIQSADLKPLPLWKEVGIGEYN